MKRINKNGVKMFQTSVVYPFRFRQTLLDNNINLSRFLAEALKERFEAKGTPEEAIEKVGFLQKEVEHRNKKIENLLRIIKGEKVNLGKRFDMFGREIK